MNNSLSSILNYLVISPSDKPQVINLTDYPTIYYIDDLNLIIQ